MCVRDSEAAMAVQLQSQNVHQCAAAIAEATTGSVQQTGVAIHN